MKAFRLTVTIGDDTRYGIYVVAPSIVRAIELVAPGKVESISEAGDVTAIAVEALAWTRPIVGRVA